MVKEKRLKTQGKVMGRGRKEESFRHSKKGESNVISRALSIKFHFILGRISRRSGGEEQRCCSERCNDESPLVLATVAQYTRALRGYV